ncbi:kinase-like protein [Suillus lakei]|nr:kinase-like protein [Suillus lakei]
MYILQESETDQMKALTVYVADQLGAAKTKKIKRIQRELRICAKLKHANILPVYGYTYGFGPFIAIVSPWAENGNLTVYLEHEGVALTLVRRFQMLRDIITGLQYLHANSVIHGDFNGMAPELLVDREDGSEARPSEQSDIYSFGGIMLQVLTNKVPYHHLSKDAAIVLCIAKSQTPSRARYLELPDKYWPFIEQCWSADPRDRPSTEGADVTIRNEFYSLSGSP